MAGKAFRKGISLVDLMDMFPNDEVAEDWFGFPGRTALPQLSDINERESPDNAIPLPRLPQFYSSKTGTVMPARSSDTASGHWQSTSSHWTQGNVRMKLHRDLGIARHGIWHTASDHSERRPS